MIYDIAIIGAGASGLMVASQLLNQNIAIIDSNSSIGSKIRVSGGGRCNVTNEDVSVENYLGDREFIGEALRCFSSKNLLEFFSEVELEKRANGQYFCKNSSKDIVSIFTKLTRHCRFFMESKVLHVEFKECFVIKTSERTIKAKKLVVASGGISFTSLGATPIGYEIAKSFGHTVVTPAPALVGFTVQKEQFWMKSLSGVSLLVELFVEDKAFQRDLLFTYKGISGPAVLSGSLYWKKGRIIVDFLPKYELGKLLNRKSKKRISSLIPLPKRFVLEFLNSLHVEDIAMDRVKPEELEKLQQLKRYEFSPAGNFGFSKAEVTKGGVCTDEVDSLTLESKLQKNLFFVGEVLDVTGELGGYNFQWAFSSAVLMAKADSTTL